MKTLIFFIILTLISCKPEIKKHINIDLSFINTKNNLFVERIIPLNFMSNKDDFIGIPKGLDYWEIFKLNNYTLFGKDTLKPTFGNTAKYTFVLSGRKNSSIVMIVDNDNDKNFSNNEENIFKDISNMSRSKITGSSVMLNSPIYEIKQSNLKFKIFPFPNYYTSTKHEELNELQIVITPFGYWYGEFENLGLKYKVALKNYLPKIESEILITKVEDSFQTINSNNYFPYLKLDKIKINKNIYLIDSLDNNHNKLKLKYLKENNLNLIGLREGFVLENYNLELINERKIRIKELLIDKDYLLLDFWGTWCVPCIDLIPEVKKITQQYSNTQVLGIALDKKKELVSRFIEENDIKYPNCFISFEGAVSKNSIISSQKISNYPYYILIDKNMKIIYRGFGKKALEKIKFSISQIKN